MVVGRCIHRSFLAIERRCCGISLVSAPFRKYSTETNRAPSNWPWFGIAWMSLLGGATFLSAKYALEAYHDHIKVGQVRSFLLHREFNRVADPPVTFSANSTIL